MEKRHEVDNVRAQLQLPYPIRGWIYVGAGGGSQFERYSLDTLPALLAIEAIGSVFDRLKEKFQDRPEWICVHEVIKEDANACSFYEMTPLSESGVLAPKLLTAYWRNLKLREKSTREACTLSKVVNQVSDVNGISYNWLTVDCFPGRSILEGAGDLLHGLDVVEVRVIADEKGETAINGAMHGEVDGLLTGQNFSLCAVVDERNPAFARRFYTRNWRHCFHHAERSLCALASERDERVKVLSDEKERSAADAERLRTANEVLQETLNAAVGAEQLLQEKLLLSERKVSALNERQMGLTRALKERDHQVQSLQNEKLEQEAVGELREQNQRLQKEVEKIARTAEQRSSRAEIMQRQVDNLRAELVGAQDETLRLEKEKALEVESRRAYLRELEQANAQVLMIRALIQGRALSKESNA